MLFPRITWKPWSLHNCSPSEAPTWSSSTQVFNFWVSYSFIRNISTNPSNFSKQTQNPLAPLNLLVTYFGPLFCVVGDVRFCKYQNRPCFTGHPSEYCSLHCKAYHTSAQEKCPRPGFLYFLNFSFIYCFVWFCHNYCFWVSAAQFSSFNHAVYGARKSLWYSESMYIASLNALNH